MVRQEGLISALSALLSFMQYPENIEPKDLSRDLREGKNEFLDNRRIITALSLFNIAMMGIISLYQMGVTKTLHEPPIPGLDAEKVNGSAQAYELFSTPDAVLGLGSYAATLGLAAMGSSNRSRTLPLIPIALLVKATLDALASAKLSYDQPTRYKAACLYCIGGALATFAVLPFAWPEARVAWGELRSK